jgi:hypothetical protein
MNIRSACGALILGGLVATIVPLTLSLAQSNQTGVSAPTNSRASASKDAGAAAPKRASPNAAMTPRKDRYWRHRGGRHPHYGSRRLRTNQNSPPLTQGFV